jgi:hypothetical protein
MVQLNIKEARALDNNLDICKFHGGRRSAPYAFTERGVAMLSAVLKTKRANEDFAR